MEVRHPNQSNAFTDFQSPGSLPTAALLVSGMKFSALDVRMRSKHSFPKGEPPDSRHHSQNDQRGRIRQFLGGVTTDCFPDLVPRLAVSSMSCDCKSQDSAGVHP